jgi:hypothetical protein
MHRPFTRKAPIGRRRFRFRSRWQRPEHGYRRSPLEDRRQFRIPRWCGQPRYSFVCAAQLNDPVVTEPGADLNDYSSCHVGIAWRAYSILNNHGVVAGARADHLAERRHPFPS